MGWYVAGESIKCLGCVVGDRKGEMGAMEAGGHVVKEKPWWFWHGERERLQWPGFDSLTEEVSVTAIEPLPERPGKQVCPLFLVLNKCKYGQTCRFHHPKEKVASLSDLENTEGSELRKRPLKPLCKIGALTGGINEKSTLLTPSSTPATSLNSAGLPIRLGVKNCNLYMTKSSCSFGSVCYFNHPERDAMDPPGAIVAAPASHINHGFVNPALISQTMRGSASRIYRQRPGKEKCKHYMEKGKCTFKKCKYDHPPRTSDAL
ncbi:floral homeotic protein (HUA1) [Artemisia annua]|uniref:Floral homeotic protein (HUA1) n=1 Tax=Artemisia annua TaxID=35608 RepID=A0A2U1PMS2_ARTAN|nr:floral homeotic protein (HUA1) [Artemisia annua]